MLTTQIVIVLTSLSMVFATYNPKARNTISVYWGQNALNLEVVEDTQKRLSYYCNSKSLNSQITCRNKLLLANYLSDTNVDIIPLSFMVSLSNEVLNFASSTKCQPIADSPHKYCPEIEEDIIACQNIYEKTILLSMGGSMYYEGGFYSKDAAITAANNIWTTFGPDMSKPDARPFGKAIIDGFDIDIETPTQYMLPFAYQLRRLMDESIKTNNRPYYLTAAPQCTYPDAYFGPLLDGSIKYDALMVQFYNNLCGADAFVPGDDFQENFNFASWDNWSKNVSQYPDVKIMLGIPGGITASSTGYIAGDNLTSLIHYAQNFSSFGGVMLWDMTEIENDTNVFNTVVATLRHPFDPHHEPGSPDKTLSDEQVHESSACSIWYKRNSWIFLLLASEYLIVNLLL